MTTKQPEALRLAESISRMDTFTEYQRVELDKAAAELRRLHAENEGLRASLRWHIRTYRVADEAWNPDAQVERLMTLEMKGEK